MSVFVDTSAILAALDGGSTEHPSVVEAWNELLDRKTRFVTTSYIVVETTAVAQSRLGLDAVRALESTVWPLLTIRWIDEEIHRASTSALLAANRRGLSLVDCTSFEVMRRHGLQTALTLDADFARQGFRSIPESSQ